MNRSKKQKPIEEPHWECSVCTYRNAPEAFKCMMCDVRKGTSTRKPKVNLQLASANQQFATTSTKNVNKREDESNHKSDKRKKKFKKLWRPSKLKNIDRSSAQAREITINNLTIMITEYKVKEKRSNHVDQAEHSSASEISSHSESGVDSSVNSVSSGKTKSAS